MNKKSRILCVDDQLEALQAIKALLEITGVEVITATSASEALQLVQNDGPFFMVLSDYEMPNMKGTELLRKIREFIPEAIRILISGGLVQQEADAFISNGDCERFIAKPWNGSEMIRMLYEEMGHSTDTNII